MTKKKSAIKDKKPARVATMWIVGAIDQQKHGQFIRDLNACENDPNVDVIEIHICSEGGEISYGISIFEAMRLAEKPVETVAQGAASSAAALILQAGRKRTATKHSKLMLHPPIVAYNKDISFDEEDLVSALAKYRSHEVMMLRIISEKTGKTPEQIKGDIGSRRYFTAEEALKYGLTDEIV